MSEKARFQVGLVSEDSGAGQSLAEVWLEENLISALGMPTMAAAACGGITNQLPHLVSAEGRQSGQEPSPDSSSQPGH